MTNLTAAARLKVNGDTFFLPVPGNGVYFRNNKGTFRMEGEMIDRWIEKLIPMFNGEYTLAHLTEGLSAPVRNRVFEIAEVLYEKGFVRDVSRDRAHQLTDEIVQKYGTQIAFLESFGDSGAFRFQSYRQANALAVGSGPFLVSLVSALIESGLPKLHVLITNSAPTNRQRLRVLAEQARKTDPEVQLEEVILQYEGASGWRDLVQPFEAILYVSQEGDSEEFRLLHKVCIEEKKILLPAMRLHQTGMAGPLVHPNSEGCWESAWRRIHRTEVYRAPEEQYAFSSTAGALLANVIVFELFKTIGGVTESQLRNSFFLLDLETLEGKWHSFLPHPSVQGGIAAERIQDWDSLLKRSQTQTTSTGLFPYFSQLTSAQTGIFHIWEEGDLMQLPLSQCRVQAVDPLSEGPADLLPAFVCTGLTHEEARREAGLVGIETYVSRLAGILAVGPETKFGAGAGETAAEAVARGLQAHLAESFASQLRNRPPSVVKVRLSDVLDERCRFYLQSLISMRGTPSIGLGENVFGFPVVWVGTGDCWYGSVGLNVTLALRKALQAALLKQQNQTSCRMPQVREISSVFIGEQSPKILTIPTSADTAQPEVLRDALQILGNNGKRLTVADMAVEPFLKQVPGGVFGVSLREGAGK
ncbi:putative thiazole-containing bacteriocin maturation protein [Paenibacillus thermotolerans]|uniref:putative thiazole-containing bacteriocin maturation protein n=1 Tax=Paenibacillus thermotolerans TaxID=3027807 RepID=UPI002368EA50|nr:MULTISPECIES: putative thiazole-containing bacteriocin maturation protein [unclassified Paenibacillus]